MLGKGIESLIPKKKEQRPTQPKKEAVFLIEIEKIQPNPYQPRREFDQEGLKALADSIKNHGILQPLVVSKIEKEIPGGTQVFYQLIAGERRLLAARIAGLSQVPVIIREPTEKEKLELSLIENAQRLDLNPMEKAQAYQRLKDEFGYSQKEIGELVGKSRVAIANTLRLFDLPKEIQNALREGRISEGHARAILTVKTAQKQLELYSKVLKSGLSAAATESQAQKMNIWQPIQKKRVEISAEIKKLEEKIRQLFSIKTLKLKIEAGKPKLTIFFKSKKELDNFLKKIKP
jgi:ParB family chromosome partitioning protein